MCSQKAEAREEVRVGQQVRDIHSPFVTHTQATSSLHQTGMASGYFLLEPPGGAALLELGRD